MRQQIARSLKLISFLLILFPTLGLAEPKTYFCQDSLGKLPIRQDGRVKPLSVHANESIKHLTGESSHNNLSAVQTYCLLSLNGMGMSQDLGLKAKVQHVKVKELLGLSEDQNTLPYSELKDWKTDLRRAWSSQKMKNSYKKSLGSLMGKLNLYQEIKSGQNWMFPQYSPDDEKIYWIPLTSFLTEAKVVEKEKSSNTPFISLMEEAAEQYKNVAGEKFLVEYNFSRWQLPKIALGITLLALAFFTLVRKSSVGATIAVTSVLVQTAYIAFRIYISGRAPITNMYETVLFSGYGALILSLIIALYRKEKLFAYVGLIYNTCTLMMINFAHGMLNPSINPLVPVLRDNFWLSTHVTTVILSYGAFALSWVLANMVLIQRRFGHLSKKEERYKSDLIYTCLKYGTVMLAAGVILGGVWADYSWGRFWGWDPKETWSLIALSVYMAILHGKYTSWIPQHRFIPLVAGAFSSVMMAWFGVNYILASGLHSYGFSEGGAVFLGTFFLVQAVFLVITWPKGPNSSGSGGQGQASQA